MPESGSAEAVQDAYRVLAQRIRSFAKDIREKYVDPPYTTEFGVMFLPSDFKKKEGYKRSVELSEKYGLYRQDYCGCGFSKAERQGCSV